MPTTRTSRAARRAGIAALATLTTVSSLALGAAPASAAPVTVPVTGLASVAVDGHTGNGESIVSAPSAGARFIAFSSLASNLVAGDTNGKADLFVRDTLAATTTRISTSSAGVQGNGDSGEPSISADGRYLAFASTATNLVAGDTNGVKDVFWHDRWTGITKRVNLADASITQANKSASAPVVSDDGSQVAFGSWATNLVPGDTNAVDDIFVRTIGAAVTELVSVTSNEAQLSAFSTRPAMSGNGRYVAFQSTAAEIGSDTNGVVDVFVRDRVAGTTERVSLGDTETQATVDAFGPSISDDGRYVTFQSASKGLVSDTTPSEDSVFRRDRTAGETLLVSRTSTGVSGNYGSGEATISADGMKVAFASASTNLVPGDTNQDPDIFVRTLTTADTERVNTTTSGGQLNSVGYSGAISPDGGSVSFASPGAGASGAAPDGNNGYDVFWRGTHVVEPYDDASQLIERSAKDFDGVTPSHAKVAALLAKVENGTASPSSVIDDLAHGSFDDHQAPVMRLYWSFFHRVPDQGGLDHWVNKHAGGTKLAAIATEFAKSSEFKNTYGSLSNKGFVTLVYQNVLGRAPDQAGLDHWVEALGTGSSRGDIMTAFSESSEGKRLMRVEVDSFLVSRGMLGRLPTGAELTNDVFYLDGSGGQPTEVLILSLLQSPAYAARVAS